MWSGRFREPLDASFAAWQRSFAFDWRLLPYELEASRAHAQTLAAAQVLSRAETTTILDGIDFLRQNFLEGSAGIGAGLQHESTSPTSRKAVPEAALSTPEIEDVHHFVEVELTKHIGDLARKLHTGRSRNEQVSTDLRLYVREAIDETTTALNAWAAALLDQALAAEGAVMPAYTHLQRAEPVLIAHWLLAYITMIERDLSRLADCRRRLNLCPLGSGAVAGATIALDRSISAHALGFGGPTSNSMDATSDRDFALEFAQAAAQIGLHLSRFAEEIILFATAEYAFIDLPERFATGSSAMPQKKNPDLAELMRGKSGRLIGAATTLSVIIKGLPLAYNKDLQETQEAVFEVVDTLLPMLRLVAPFTRVLGLRLDDLALAAKSGYLNAMAAATYLTRRGVPFRTAHEQIGAAVRFALSRGVELQELTLQELAQFGSAFDESFYAACTLEATLDCHDVHGGTARNRVIAALAEARQRFGVAPHSSTVMADVS